MKKNLLIGLIVILFVVLTGLVVKYQVTIKALTENIEEIQSENDYVEGKLYDLEEKINDNESSISDLEYNINDLDNRLTDLE